MPIPGSDRPTTVDEYTEWNAAAWARSPVSRRSIVKAALGGVALAQFPLARAAFAAGGGRSGPSNIAISGRHLSWVSDSTGDPTNAMRATAQLVSPTGDAYFRTAPSRRHLGTGHPAPDPFTFTAFADVGTNIAPTDPRYAWGHDPAMVTANRPAAAGRGPGLGRRGHVAAANRPASA
ncbi:MAG: hypothetical protein ABJA87_07365 [bacterium]